MVIPYDDELSTLAKSIIKWMAENKWLNEDPEDHDFSFEYFFNFFKKKYPNLTETILDDAIWELKFQSLVEAKMLPEDGHRIDIIRGLTPEGLKYYKDFLK